MMTKYFKRMGEDERVIAIYKNGRFHTVASFSICDDYNQYVDKKMFEYLPHDTNGHICFVEYLISAGWNKELRKRIEEIIVEKYPNITEGIWYRPSKNDDRKFVYRRKLNEASI